MKKENRIDYLFSRVKEELNRNDLIMDFASIYGGYRIEIVYPSTGRGNFERSGRISKKEMESYLEGLLRGIWISKEKKD